MFVSVIVPVYNIKEYIEDCVNSILKQDYNDYELILVDDGSVDGSGEICENYSKTNSRIKVVHQINGGLSRARNTGISQASGEWIYFVDGDDLISETTLTSFVKIIEKYPGLDYIHGRMSFFYKDDKEFTPSMDYLDTNWTYDLSPQDVFVKVYRDGGRFLMGIRGFYNKRFLINNKLFFTNGLYAEDQEFTVRLLVAAQRIGGNTEALYKYRMGRVGSLMNTMTASKTKTLMDIYIGWEQIAKSGDVNEGFSKALLDEAGSRTRAVFFEYVTRFDKAQIQEHIDYSKDKMRLYYYGWSKNYKHALMAFLIKVFGLNNTVEIVKRLAWRHFKHRANSNMN